MARSWSDNVKGNAAPLRGPDVLNWPFFLSLVKDVQERERGTLLIADFHLLPGPDALSAGKADLELVIRLAQGIGQAIRRSDIIAHVKDYRFAVLLRRATPNFGTSISERIIESVNDTVLISRSGIVNARVRIGGAGFQPVDQRDVLENALFNLDIALKEGRPVVIA